MKIIQDIGGGILLLQLPVFSDERGSFIKMADNRLDVFGKYEQRQLNYVFNNKKFTCRGLHYQKGIFAESKIFRAINGAIQVVAFNVQTESKYYKQTFYAKLDRVDLALWIPRGFATGYFTLEDNTAVLYTSDNDYHPKAEAGLRWNDPSVNLHIKDFGKFLFSKKDLLWPNF